MSDSGKNPQRTYIRVDYSKCTGCRTCEMVCAIAHHSTAPSHSRIRVDSFFPGIDIPLLCVHCINPPCFQCPFDAMETVDGVVRIDEDTCEGCGICAQNCPIGAIRLVESKATKCDLCGRCVELCPAQALSFCETSHEAELVKPEVTVIMREILGVDKI